jgi:hypothetical protein
MSFRHLLPLALGLLVLASPVRSQDVPNGGLRIATYNAYLLSPMFKCPPGIHVEVPDCLLQIEGETERWARNLASAILADADQLDVIVLNEVWDEEAREILARRLRTVYPNQVRKLDSALVAARIEVTPESAAAEIDLNGEDSGLMLFAKRDFRFAPLPDTTYRWSNSSADTLDATTPHVAFVLFEACGASDCFAAKGAALVRLEHIASGQVHNVAFTHLQADYPDDGEAFADVRTKQLSAIEKLIETTLPGLDTRLESARETLFLAGDLNITYFADRTEWNKRFADPASYFRKRLYEVMAHTSASEDDASTVEGEHERLDYILAGDGPFTTPGARRQQPCVQHVTVPIAFRDTESDHFMVRADVQFGSYLCSPAIAHKIPLSQGVAETIDFMPSNPAVDFTRIRFPGAMQWFYVDADGPGTYSIGTDSNAIGIEVYLPEDMTTPVSRYNQTKAQVGHCILRCFATDTYVLPSRFYVKVRGNQRTTTGNYAFRVRKHACSSKHDACYLAPGQGATATLSPEQLPPGQLTRQDEAWFRFDIVDRATSDDLQTVTLTADGVDGERVVAKLVDTAFSPASTLPAVTQSGTTHVATLKADDGSTGYLHIRQESALQGPTSLSVRYDSNLRYLDVGSLVCYDETNPETGSDDIFTRFRIDGANRRAPTSGYVEFDCNESRHSRAWGPVLGMSQVRYLDEVSIRLIEEDDASANDQSNRFAIPDLAPGVVASGDRYLEWKFDGGHYRFNYRLALRRNAPVAD